MNTHPDHKIWKRDFKGASGIFGIEFKKEIKEKAVEYFADQCKLFGKGASWGGYESLMTMTDLASSRSLPSSYVPKGQYLRIYIGIEDIEDLIEDINSSLKKMRIKFKIK